MGKRYRIVLHIARGNFGFVVKAYDSQTRKNVAIKIFTKGNDETAAKEIRIHKFLQPKFGTTPRNVVTYYESFKSEGQWNIVLELLGNSLKQLMNETEVGLVLKKLRIVAKSILLGLEFLHTSGLIHTDLKPDNIVTQKKGSLECKIVDLGLCIIVEEVDDNTDIKGPLQPRMYRAPEVLLRAPLDEKIDVFGIGCILAELCMRKSIFSGEKYVSQMASMVEYLGFPSIELLENSPKASTFFDIDKNNISFKRRENMRVVQPRSRSLKNFFKGKEDMNFIHFMERCLCITSDYRASASELLEHPWIKTEDNRRLSPV